MVTTNEHDNCVILYLSFYQLYLTYLPIRRVAKFFFFGGGGGGGTLGQNSKFCQKNWGNFYKIKQFFKYINIFWQSHVIFTAKLKKFDNFLKI